MPWVSVCWEKEKLNVHIMACKRKEVKLKFWVTHRVFKWDRKAPTTHIGPPLYKCPSVTYTLCPPIREVRAFWVYSSGNKPCRLNSPLRLDFVGHLEMVLIYAFFYCILQKPQQGGRSLHEAWIAFHGDSTGAGQCVVDAGERKRGEKMWVKIRVSKLLKSVNQSCNRTHHWLSLSYCPTHL